MKVDGDFRMRCLLLLGALCLTPGVSRADEPKPAQPPKSARAPKVVALEEIRVEGRVQKPNAFYILNRSNLAFDIMERRMSFIDEVVTAVRHPPF
jgi:hypothetical protein